MLHLHSYNRRIRIYQPALLHFLPLSCSALRLLDQLVNRDLRPPDHHLVEVPVVPLPLPLPLPLGSSGRDRSWSWSWRRIRPRSSTSSSSYSSPWFSSLRGRGRAWLVEGQTNSNFPKLNTGPFYVYFRPNFEQLEGDIRNSYSVVLPPLVSSNAVAVTSYFHH